MKNWILLLLSVVMSVGCAKLAHIDELLTLKGVADEQARNDKSIKEYDALFFKLVEAERNGALQDETKKSILRKYPQPIYAETTVLDGLETDRWIYRQSVKYFDSEQVHLYFDADGKLIKSEYIPAPVKESKAVSDVQAANPAP